MKMLFEIDINYLKEQMDKIGLSVNDYENPSYDELVKICEYLKNNKDSLILRVYVGNFSYEYEGKCIPIPLDRIENICSIWKNKINKVPDRKNKEPVIV